MRVSPGSPTPIEPGGTYAHSPPHEPTIKPPISGIIGYHWQLQKHPPFPDFLGKSSRYHGQKIPLSRENGNTHAAPHAFVGGGGVSLVIDAKCPQNVDFMIFLIITHDIGVEK